MGWSVRYAPLNSALADWQARVGAAGVLWAQRFQQTSDMTRWSPDVTGYATLQANEGIIPGDYCLRQTVPAGAGGVAGASRWARPLQPQPGDINQPGVALGAGGNYLALWNSSANAYVMNPAYAGVPHGTPLRSGVSMGADIYLQFRVRYSANRYNAGVAAGKMLYVTCNYIDPTQELVLRANSTSVGPVRAIFPYTNFSNAWNSALEDPQGSGGGGSGSKEPGGAYAACTNSNQGACYLWQPGVWQTVLVHIKPGTQCGPSHVLANADNNASRNTTVEIWVAQPGETTYTLVSRKTDYVWQYDDSAQNGSTPGVYHAYGFSWMELNPYTGGGAWASNSETFYHEFDQVICSLQPIACPQV